LLAVGVSSRCFLEAVNIEKSPSIIDDCEVLEARVGIGRFSPRLQLKHA
jgi:hypothetical protein